MLKMPSQREEECLDILKQDIERHFSNIRFRNYKGKLYRAGLVALQKEIGVDTSHGETTAIGLNTIFRIWEYGEVADPTKDYTPSSSILSRLARSIGYIDWDHYCDSITATIDKRLMNDPSDLRVEAMWCGQRFTLGWYPHRYAKLEYLDHFDFKIIETKGLGRTEGEIITASGFRLMPNNKSIYPRIGLEPYGDDNIEEPFEFLDVIEDPNLEIGDFDQLFDSRYSQ